MYVSSEEKKGGLKRLGINKCKFSCSFFASNLHRYDYNTLGPSIQRKTTMDCYPQHYIQILEQIKYEQIVYLQRMEYSLFHLIVNVNMEEEINSHHIVHMISCNFHASNLQWCGYNNLVIPKKCSHFRQCLYRLKKNNLINMMANISSHSLVSS